MIIIDTHAHLDQVEDVEAALSRAAALGVAAVLAVGVDLESNKKNLALAQKTNRPRIYCALGLHPENIATPEIDRTLEFIRKNISGAVAVGEIGLDYWYKDVRKDTARKQQQQDVFRRQLALAKECNLPVVVHSRGAWKDCLDMTRQAGIKRAVFHWYSGPLDILAGILNEGYFISATPSLAYSPPSRQAVKAAPLEQTLIETDCPVLYRASPQDSGFRAQPKDVFRTLELYAQLKEIDRQEALKRLNENAQELFGIDLEKENV